MDKHRPPFPPIKPDEHRPPHPPAPPYGTYDMYGRPFPPHHKPDSHCARFTPHLLHYHIPKHFKFWCNKVVPLVYDDSLSYMELLNKVVLYLNNMLEDEKAVALNMEEICRAFADLEMFVNDYFAYYQSKGLINNDIAVTNDNYLEILPDCDTAQMNTIYRLKFVEGSTQTIPANLPEEAKPFSGAECVLVNLSNFVLKLVGDEWQEIPPNGCQYDTTNNYQMLFTDKDIFYRENNGDSWLEWNSIFGGWAKANLGKLAYKDSASGDYTPTGIVSQPTFTGNEATISVSGTPTGTVSQPTFVGNASEITVVGLPTGTVSQPTFTGATDTISVTGEIEGDVSQPTFTGTPNVHNHSATLHSTEVNYDMDEYTVNSISDEGTLPMITYDSNTETLTFDSGSLPTYDEINVITGITNVNVIDDTIDVDDETITPQGTVSKPEFDGESFSLTTTYTPRGTVSQPTFTGTNLTSQGVYTPTGTVSQPTFTGDSLTSTGTHTPTGTVSQPTFTGDEATITVE